jgi:hypothetical protein
MSREDDKLKNSLRRHRDDVAVKRQAKIAKEHGAPVKNPHRLHKKHAMDCGNPGCFLCGNPRKIHKDKLTQQEKRLFQDVDTPNDRHSNGVKNDQEDLL